MGEQTVYLYILGSFLFTHELAHTYVVYECANFVDKITLHCDADVPCDKNYYINHQMPEIK